ncbi:MAG TPA: ATP-binding cassette domain-containing protein [Candidatus Dormibacteraeota bacterium]|nr:ATP-binding cassette domain-containing protein [Candidatus Dormibacteraeota bacterium]
MSGASVRDGGGRPLAPILEARGLSKSFGSVRALVDVNLDLHPGEVLGLMGDNGAGKSTTVKILSGALQPDAGEIRIGGRPVQLRSPIDARRVGIETVYQDLAVVPMLDVAENLFLGRELRRRGLLGMFRLLDKRNMRRQAAERLQALNVGIDSVRQRVDTLSGGQRQGVAVGRAVAFGRRIVIMDEPTAALGVRESRRVIELIQLIRRQGLSVILISHNLPQVLEVSDRIMVLRNGRRVGVVRTAETDMQQVVRLITGAEVLEQPAA